MPRFPATSPPPLDGACKLTILVPVYNEAATLAQVLDEVRALDVDKEIIVIDNVSTDGTREQVAALAGEAGVLPVLQTVNRGKGSSVRVGLALARGEFTICQDADVEYNPTDILRLLARAEAEGRDAVFGSRLLGHRPSVPWHHALGRDALNGLFGVLYGSRVTDVATCYKLLRTRVAQSLVLESVGFDLDYELPGRLRRAGVSLVEEPVSYAPRDLAAGKKLRWTDGLVALRALLRSRLPESRRVAALEVGTAVEIIDGPFTGCRGEVVEAGRDEIVHVAFGLHGREATVAFRARALRQEEHDAED
jgi:glycosyltransferase involved in cell wall biosynthesis